MMMYYSVFCLVYVIFINILDFRDKGMLNLNDKSKMLGILRARIEERFVRKSSILEKENSSNQNEEHK